MPRSSYAMAIILPPTSNADPPPPSSSYLLRLTLTMFEHEKRLLAIERTVSSPDSLAECLRCVSEVYLCCNKLEDAETSLKCAVELHQQAQDVLGEAYDLLTLGDLYMRRNNLDDAEASLTSAVELHQQAHSVLGEANDLLTLEDLYMQRDNLNDAYCCCYAFVQILWVYSRGLGVDMS